jgi:hypothetical protein
MWATIGQQLLMLVCVGALTITYAWRNKLRRQGKLTELEGNSDFYYTLWYYLDSCMQYLVMYFEITVLCECSILLSETSFASPNGVITSGKADMSSAAEPRDDEWVNYTDFNPLLQSSGWLCGRWGLLDSHSTRRWSPTHRSIKRHVSIFFQIPQRTHNT